MEEKGPKWTMTDSSRGIWWQGVYHRNPKDGSPGEAVKLALCWEGKVSFPGRDFGGGESCGRRGETEQRPGGVTENRER